MKKRERETVFDLCMSFLSPNANCDGAKVNLVYVCACVFVLCMHASRTNRTIENAGFVNSLNMWV